ncbi:MAG TPA: patatin-like phospholipase family protein [Hymenobacter sp.]|jgi:NTE family protein|uniref:patatin-like phospholipase family protein n=1 Tax=Hymenobacter sp. TaxID=1898978 RepID=UPI002EDB22EA
MTTALITSGGGAKGAFTVGALKYWFEQGYGLFNYISGTSTGALLATFACIGDINTLLDVYTRVGNDDILQKQNLIDNFRHGRPYIFNTEPLNELIRQSITEDVYTRIMGSTTLLCLTAVSLQTGLITIFSNREIPASSAYVNKVVTSREMLLEALQASSNQAGFLPPVEIDGEQYVDGGNREVLPTLAIPGLRPERVLALSNNPRRMEQISSPYTNLLNVIMRAISIFIQEVRENDIALLNLYARQSGAQCVIVEPDRDLDPDYPTGLRFDQVLMGLWISKGEQTAKTLLESTPGFLA